MGCRCEATQPGGVRRSSRRQGCCPATSRLEGRAGDMARSHRSRHLELFAVFLKEATRVKGKSRHPCRPGPESAGGGDGRDAGSCARLEGVTLRPSDRIAVLPPKGIAMADAAERLLEALLHEKLRFAPPGRACACRRGVRDLPAASAPGRDAFSPCRSARKPYAAAGGYRTQNRVSLAPRSKQRDGGRDMADSKTTPAVAETTEHQIAVHWKEEEYFNPPASFVAQANLRDAAVNERFAEKNFPECFEEYADMLTGTNGGTRCSTPTIRRSGNGSSAARSTPPYNCVDRHLESTGTRRPSFSSRNRRTRTP